MNTAPDVTEETNVTRNQIWIALLVALFVLLVFFRQQILNHFSFLSGDRNDGVIQVALLEHWFNALRGLSDWSSPNYFFPHKNTLGYNEGLFLYGLIYSCFRFFSFDPFLSSELVNVVVKALGFAGFLAASRQILKLPFWWSLLGASIFTLSNNSFLQGIHAQLLSVSFVPIEAALIYESYKALIASRKLRFLVWGSLTSLLFSAWLLTCLYIAWFFALFVSITVGIQFAIGGMVVINKMKHALSENKVVILAVGVIAAVSLIPFMSVYVVGHHVQQRPWGDVLSYVPTILDSINVGPNNLLFGDMISIMKRWCEICAIGNGELEAGIAPILFVLAALCIAGIIERRVPIPPHRRILIRGIAMACAVTWLLSIRIGQFTGWYLIYKFWPGARGLRVVSRILLFLSAPVVAFAILYLSQMASRWNKLFVVILCGLLLVEEVNENPTVLLDRFQELERTVSVRMPPTVCRAFFTTESPDTDDRDSSSVTDALYPHNVDAMLIAEYVNLPTINGFASFNPRDWNFGYPTKPDYSLRVEKYAKLHSLTELCRLDLTTMHWDTNPSFVESINSSLGFWDFASNDAIPSDMLNGFSQAEPFGRWSSGPRASFKYAVAADSKRPTKVRIIVATALVKGSHTQRMLVSINGSPKQEFLFRNSSRRNIELAIPASATNQVEINFEFPDSVSPKDLGINEDTRQLAVGVKSIEIK